MFKAIGMSLNLEVNEDTLDTTEMETFLHTIGRNWEDVAQDPENREIHQTCICCCIQLSLENTKKLKILY